MCPVGVPRISGSWSIGHCWCLRGSDPGEVTTGKEWLAWPCDLASAAGGTSGKPLSGEESIGFGAKTKSPAAVRLWEGSEDRFPQGLQGCLPGRGWEEGIAPHPFYACCLPGPGLEVPVTPLSRTLLLQLPNMDPPLSAPKTDPPPSALLNPAPCPLTPPCSLYSGSICAPQGAASRQPSPEPLRGALSPSRAIDPRAEAVLWGARLPSTHLHSWLSGPRQIPPICSRLGVRLAPEAGGQQGVVSAGLQLSSSGEHCEGPDLAGTKETETRAAPHGA